jgi:DNA-binding NarL/FixJ family response regulator
LERLHHFAPAEWDRAGDDGLWVRAITAECLRLFAVSAGSEENVQHAVRLLGAADAYRTASTFEVLRVERARHDADAARLRAYVNEATFDRLSTSGQQSLSVNEAILEALALPLAPTAGSHRWPAPAWTSPIQLTRREREVLDLLCHRLTDPEIAERLFISTKTASNHVSNILTKLGATNRREAAAIAVQQGLI